MFAAIYEVASTYHPDSGSSLNLIASWPFQIIALYPILLEGRISPSPKSSSRSFYWG